MPSQKTDTEHLDKKEFFKEVSEPLQVKEFSSKSIDIREREHMMQWQGTTTKFLLSAYGALLFFTILIIFLQGFKAWGFQLESAFLHWLGGATIGEVGGLALLVYGFFFKKPR
ncbi:MAG: hypothetical protein HZA49_09305 [Planctomycetes bacterium]|nr:hypothetical protein [Planctomycetota bacterium]